jgi:hypothetical protein
MTSVKTQLCFVLFTVSLAHVALCQAQTPNAALTISITNRTDRVIRMDVSYADVRGSRPTELTLEARKDATTTENRPLLVSFQSGGRTKQYVLVPGRNYHFALGDDGELDLHRTESPDDAVNPDTSARIVRMKAVADVGYRQKFPDWERRIHSLVERVSAHFDGYFGIRFTLVECTPWEEQCVGRPANESLIRLFDVEPESAELVVGFTVIDVSRWQQAELGVTNNFGKYVLIRESTHPALANRSELIVLHELCHVFGAFHVDDPRSVMQPAIENSPYQFTVTQPTCEVLRLARQMDLSRGVESLDAETTAEITELYRKHRHPAETGEDPVTTGFAFQSLLALQKEDWHRAWAMAYEVAKRSPKNLVAHLVIGQSALKLDDAGEAANRFREVIRQKPNQAVGYHGLAVALLMAGDAMAALRSAEQAVRLSPSDKEARELRDACREILEKQRK